MSETRTWAPFPLAHGAGHLKRAESPPSRVGAEGESKMKLGPRPTGRYWHRAWTGRRRSEAKTILHAITSRKSHLNQGQLVELALQAKKSPMIQVGEDNGQ